MRTSYTWNYNNTIEVMPIDENIYSSASFVNHAEDEVENISYSTLFKDRKEAPKPNWSILGLYEWR